MFLLPGLGCPNFCRMADQAFDSQLFHEVHKPLHRSRGFDTHSHRAWKRGIKLSHVVAFALESHFHYLSRFRVQHRQRLLASVQITSYNSHLGLLRSALYRVNTEQLITERMIRRGTFRSVEELERAIYAWLANWNNKPQAFG